MAVCCKRTCHTCRSEKQLYFGAPDIDRVLRMLPACLAILLPLPCQCWGVNARCSSSVSLSETAGRSTAPMACISSAVRSTDSIRESRSTMRVRLSVKLTILCGSDQLNDLTNISMGCKGGSAGLWMRQRQQKCRTETRNAVPLKQHPPQLSLCKTQISCIRTADCDRNPCTTASIGPGVSHKDHLAEMALHHHPTQPRRTAE